MNAPAKTQIAAGQSAEDAVLSVIESETMAFRAGDFDRWEACWLRDERTCEAYASHEFGLEVVRGWEQVRAHMRGVFDRDLRCASGERGPEIFNASVTVDRDTAWAIYDQRWWHPGDETCTDNFETRILERHAGEWKIVFSSTTTARDDFAPPGRVGVDAERRVVWSSPGALEALEAHGGLTVSHGKLRAIRPAWDRALGEVLTRAAGHHGFFQSRSFAADTGRPFRCPIVLGEDDEGRVISCTATVKDGVTYIDTDTDSRIASRLGVAQAIFGLSAAQTALAAHIVAGQGLTAAAESLGISINTARTQLGRIYAKTGINSQTALVRVLLSVG